MSEEDIKDCPVDKNGDLEDPNNLFTCKASESCCTVELKPACCSTKDINEELLDQLKLWGPLLLVIFLIALFIWWCRSDESCCDVEKPWLYRCGCKKLGPKDENIESLNGSRLSIRSSKTVVTIEEEVLGHDAAELELAAQNLEEQLDREAQEEKGEVENNSEEDEKLVEFEDEEDTDDDTSEDELDEKE